MQNDLKEVEVLEIPECQFPHYLTAIRTSASHSVNPETNNLLSSSVKATHDARLLAAGSTWAYVCQFHFDFFKCKVGLGYGQKLIQKKKEGK